jgi:hypothetical protein
MCQDYDKITLNMKDLKTTTKKLAKFFPVIGGYTVSQPGGLNPGFTGPGALAFSISRFFSFALAIVGILGFLYLLFAGFQYLMSKGDPKALAAAQARLTYTIIGLIIVFLAYAITNYVISLFGLKTV